MNIGTFMLKQVAFVVNLLLWLLGLVMFFIGVWIRSDPNFWEYQENLPLGNFYSACYICIYTGAIILIIGFVGCVGTFIDSPCILWTYMSFTCVFILLECTVAGLVWQIPSGDGIQNYMRDEIMKRLVTIYETHEARRFMDLLQIHMECCGASDKNDYQRNHLTIPQSCSNYRTNNIYIYGCSENLRVHLQRHGASLGGLSLSLVFVQVVSLLVNFMLIQNLRGEYLADYY